MDSKQIKKKIEKLLKEDANKKCIDCGCRNPRWASAKYGVFFCIECAGHHRSVGVNYDFVKSVSLDEWSENEWFVVMYGGNQRFNNYIKENRIEIDNIFDKYTNNKVMRYSQDLMNRIKKEQGIEIDSACNNKDLKTTNIFSETVKSTFSERVKEFPQMATECKNNSSTYIKDKVSYLKEKVTNYSPELAQIGATTFVMADKLSSVLIDTTKKIGNKTITVTSNIGSKIYGEVKEYLDKIKSDKTESSLKSANTINYVYNPRSPLNEKKQDWS